MSEEELSDRMILIINGYKECLDYNCNQTEERQREIKYDIETLETMIDLYNKEKETSHFLQSQLDEANAKLIEEKEKNKLTANDIENFKCQAYMLGRADENEAMKGVIQRHYISKDEIKALLQDVDNTKFINKHVKGMYLYNNLKCLLEE